MTELAGDIVVRCTGGVPTAAGQPIPAANLLVYLNTAVTSRLLNTASLVSEALLLVDEPGSQANPAQLACLSPNGCAVAGTSTSSGVAGPEPFNGSGGRPNIFQSTVSGNVLTFSNIPIDPPGNTTRTFRFTNIRVNATTAGGNSVVASLVSSGPTTVPIAGSTPTVALIQPGTTFSLRDSANAAALGSAGFAMTQGIGQDSSGTPAAYLRFTEGFSRSFKTRTSASFADGNTSPAPANQNVPGFAYNSESGFTYPLSGLTAGLADYGTRLRAIFTAIPAGVRVFAATTNTNASTRLARLIFSDAGVFSPVPASDTYGSFAVAELPVFNGTAVGLWEVLLSNPTATQNFDIPIWFTGTPAASGTGSVAGGLAPIPPTFSVSPGGAAQGVTFPIPRFDGVSSAITVVQVAPAPPPSPLTVSPSSLSFSYQTGLALPGAQTLTLTGASVLGLTAGNNGTPWLAVVQSGSSPSTLSASVNPANLPVGIYGSFITITAPNATNSPLTIPVTLNVTAAATSGPMTQTLSHIAEGAGWRTSVILVNRDSAPASFTLKFWDESGAPWRLSLGPDGFQSQVTDTIPVGGSRTIQTDGFINLLQVGSAEISSSGAVGGNAVFAFQIAGQPDTEAAVPITTLRGKRFLLPFDNSPGFATGVAVANPSAAQPAVVSVVFRNPSGQVTSSVGPYLVAAHGHVSFVIPGSAGTRGVAEFTSSGEDVAGLGIRSHGRAFTSVETLAGVPAGNKNISHIADGGGWKTTIVLVNSDSQPAPFTLRFRGDNGAALRLSLGADGQVTSLTGTIAPGGSRTIQTDGTNGTLVTGWAQLSTSFEVGGTAIFGAQVPGQPDSEAAVPILAGGGDKLLLSFDGSFGFGTGVAFANPSASESANVSVLYRDVLGRALGAASTYTLPPNGHRSVVLPVNVRGVAEITSPDTPVSALGIRSHNGAFTSVRSLVVTPALRDIVAGVNQIVSGGASGPVTPLAGDWFTIASGDDNTNTPSSFVVARQFGQGRVAALGHEGLLVNAQLKDNGVFLSNLAGWLDATVQKRVLYTTGHRENFDGTDIAPLRTALAARGFALGALPGTITPAALAAGSVLIIGNAWRDFTSAEIQAVQDFVSSGGGLLMAGAGSTWVASGSGRSIENYPMTKMAQPYGVGWQTTTIIDPDPGDQSGGSTIFHTFYPNAK
ncbi:MAG TPA: hypothetical protein VL285_10700 [Bryobacteraceae bacterium]|nr:hypothetical protein [Bryobacteraceae bacterium]